MGEVDTDMDMMLMEVDTDMMLMVDMAWVEAMAVANRRDQRHINRMANPRPFTPHTTAAAAATSYMSKDGGDQRYWTYKIISTRVHNSTRTGSCEPISLYIVPFYVFYIIFT